MKAMQFGRDTTAEDKLLARSLETFRTRARMEMVFGGPVARGGTALKITELSGTRTSSPLHLVVENGNGLGGKALAMARPTAVTSYFAADGITHHYDHAVRPEAIETLAAVPVIVDGQPRALLYLATRTQTILGDRWYDSLLPLVRDLSRRIAIEDEVRNRLRNLTPSVEAPPTAMSRRDLHDIVDELADLASLVTDETVREKIEAIGTRCAVALSKSVPETTVSLRRREIEVLREISRGASNAETAQALGLLPNTVKSYLKAAMAKLEAKNRMHAVVLAQELGLI